MNGFLVERYVSPASGQMWANVADAGSHLTQRWADVPFQKAFPITKKKMDPSKMRALFADNQRSVQLLMPSAVNKLPILCLDGMTKAKRSGRHFYD